MSEGTRCGFASVIGLPNAGKSTLVNTLVGQKVSIVSPKVQTTRMRVLGIALYEQAQIVLIDTPGIFKPSTTMEKAMVASAMASFEQVDVTLHIVDVSQKKPVEHNRQILEALKEKKNVVLVLNKIDQVDKKILLDIAANMNAVFPYEATFMISALNAKGTKDILKYLGQAMPESVWHYAEDQITDMPMRLMAAEITREKIFLKLYQEVPYAIMVETENWEEFDNGDVKIEQCVYVEKDTQKAILLGKSGSQIKAIGQASRLELENILERKVHLKIFVKVKEDWAERADHLSLYGLDVKS